MPTTPPSITALPTPPDPNDRTTFNARAYPWTVAQQTFGTQLGAVATNVFNNATEAQGFATDAQNASIDAAASEAIALGASNFKGMWSSLTGPLNRPASVKHNGQFWLLLADLPNVTTQEPSNASSVWTVLDSGVNVSQVITTNTTAVKGVRYILNATGITLTLPNLASMVKYDQFVIDILPSAGSGCLLAFGGAPFRGQSTSGGPWTLNIPNQRLTLTFENATIGYI